MRQQPQPQICATGLVPLHVPVPAALSVRPAVVMMQDFRVDPRTWPSSLIEPDGEAVHATECVGMVGAELPLHEGQLSSKSGTTRATLPASW
jgi:hypothetical protein